MDYLPIEDHGVIGDLHTAALVGTDGTVDWLCLPAFDSPSVFCSILDSEKGGHFKLHPLAKSRSQQLYIPETNVLMTRFLCAEGMAEVTDFMPVMRDMDEPHRLIRNVRVVRGTLSFRVECRPAFDYARREHTVEPCKGGYRFVPKEKLSGPPGSDGEIGQPLGLVSELPLKLLERGAVGATFRLSEGESATFVLSERPEDEPSHVLSEAAFDALLERTIRYWRSWVSGCTYTGRWRETVVRSALALKLMVYDPTGALVAAPTMGLPERVGGERNWDYRYTWLRDAAFTLYALMAIGFDDEAGKFMDWLRDRCQEDDDGLMQPLYGLDGRKKIPESELSHLSGYRGSGPVRLGNAAHEQVQLDIYGAALDAAYLYNKHGAPLDYDLWQNLRRILNWLCDNWRQPDDGIWEVRGGRRQFVSSKVMCWVALERAMRIAAQRGLPAGDGRWQRVRDDIYEEIMDRGWNERKQAFVQHYDSDALDASVLLMPLVKFVGPTDPRWQSTLEAVQRELAHDTLVDRYRVGKAASDGLEGDEGSFSICSFWLVECLTRAGRLEDARLAFDKMLSYANHLGLYAEEIGSSGEHLGNFPQAFTHLSLISAAVHLDRALGSR
ncbi:Glucoamylase and related glycosyl hydrolase [Rubrobacter radiotolerans]|uniref:Glucoamylase and related glycosyl hydrolase n=1 Tax=Rubrobacter radiotolerans TaxID=42256 RepID=A0A023X2F4_RUBRA|nr:glycoside hydrolase family 15 protein [Rubrobacter radiotolerans]AHY46523.1 Glucoamylase and related glycosyl hydrolase [Rubrobacter radiotolerans]MDX5893930.1 glycoside hydrolase family 15 protein [Rubrobacter radiotolerans]SMC04782.1 Glucoamylase (glucan-1,4-alpha-glucosidase), GH15 family [Rubrobacter radiotolerans DSM 5868]